MIAHKGQDIVAHEITVVAALGGVVERTWNQGAIGFGKYIVLRYERSDKTKFQTVYGHLKEFKVKEKQKVGRGDVIGVSGDTGGSDGPHLHFEVIGKPN